MGAVHRHAIPAAAAAVFLLPATASAQLFPNLPFDYRQGHYEVLSGSHLRLSGEVQINGEDFDLSADQVDIYIEAEETESDGDAGTVPEGEPGSGGEAESAAPDGDAEAGDGEPEDDAEEDDEPVDPLADVTARLVASGSVVYSGLDARISADRLEYRTDDQTAVFENASGSISLADEVDRSMFGTQEPDMLFYGQRIERLAARTYRITRGAFTSCVQPTPRWELVSSSFTINLDSYVILRNAVLKVKGVPVFYIPALPYPVPEEGRATGLLMPTWGNSSYHGSSFSNAFFLALGRSQDVTLYNDWYTSLGGMGSAAEYRYTRGGGSQGNARIHYLNEHEAEVTGRGGTFTRQARKSYRLTGQTRQALPAGWMARGQLNYFSNIDVQQTYNHNVFDASNSSRSMSGNVSGQVGRYQLSGTFDRSETFFGGTHSAVYGGGPRVTVGQGKTEIPGTPLYYSLDTEYVRLLRASRIRNATATEVVDSGLNRFDVNPTLQFPFTQWPFLTFDSSAQFRWTYWDESLEDRRQVPVGVGRSYFELASTVTGPSFVKIWDTPGSGYSERMKHLIEPWWGIRRVSPIDAFDRIVRIEGIDSIVGDIWQYQYGLDTRLFARVYEGGRGESVAREILSASVTQSYYTDENASQYDRTFRTSFTGASPTHWSPMSFVVRADPTRQIGATMRAEVDPTYRTLRSISAEGSYERGGWFEVRGGWSQRRFIAQLPGFNDRSRLDHYLNAYTSLRTPDNVLGGLYSFNYDFRRGHHLMQRVLVYYNAQCCNISFEYQVYNFEGLGARAFLPNDRRVNVSFTLAGLGRFANVFGALGSGVN